MSSSQAPNKQFCSGRCQGIAGAPQVRNFIAHMRRTGGRGVPRLNCGVMRTFAHGARLGRVPIIHSHECQPQSTTRV